MQALVEDCYLAGTQAYYFYHQRKGFNAQTDNLLTRLAKLSLQSAAVTVPIQLAIVISAGETILSADVELTVRRSARAARACSHDRDDL